MGLDVFSVCAKLYLDTTEYASALTNAAKGLQNFGKLAKNSVKLVGDVWASGARAAVEMGKAFISNSAEVAAYGDNIDKMSQKMGLSAEAYQEWSAVMQHSGTSIESLQAGMKTLANAVESGNGAFERLGISQEQIAKMSNEELFSATITALQNVENETERTYLAGQLLGRGATELGALLNTSAEDTQAMKDRVHELGGVMSDEAVKAAAAFQDNLQDLKTAISGITRGITTDFLPGISTLMAGFTQLVSNGEGAAALISEGAKSVESTFSDTVGSITEKINSFDPDIASSITGSLLGIADSAGGLVLSVAEAVLKQIPTALPIIVDGGIKLFSGLVESINSVAGGIVEVLPDVVKKLSSAFSENAPQFISMGAELLVTIANGIAQSAEPIASAVTSVMPALLDTVAQNLPLLLDSGLQIIEGIGRGVVENLPAILSSAGALISSFTTYIFENLPEILETGQELLSTVITGITENLPQFANSAFELITALANYTLENLPQLLDTASQIILMLADGLINNLPSIADSAGKIIVKLASSIAQNLPTILQKGFEVATKLAQGLIKAIPEVAKSAVTLVKSLAQEFKQYDWLTLGKNIINGIKDGVVSFGGELITAILDTAGGAFDAVKKFFGIASPSKLMRDEIGRYIPEGIAAGITEYEGSVSKAMQGISTLAAATPIDISTEITASRVTQVNSAGSETAPNIFSLQQREMPDTAVFEIYLDGERTARTVMPYVDIMMGAKMKLVGRGM